MWVHRGSNFVIYYRNRFTAGKKNQLTSRQIKRVLVLPYKVKDCFY